MAALSPSVPLLAWGMPFWGWGDEMQASPPPRSRSQLRPSMLVTVPLPAGGWRAVLQPGSSPLSHYEFDVLISAGGGRFVPEGDSSGSLHPRDWYGGLGGGSHLSHPAGFKRKETRGKLAIGITTNFINRHSRAEVEVAEISGVARIYNQKFFQNLYNKMGRWSWPQHGGCWGSLSPLVQLEGQPQDVPSVMGCMSPHGTPLQGTFGG